MRGANGVGKKNRGGSEGFGLGESSGGKGGGGSWRERGCWGASWASRPLGGVKGKFSSYWEGKSSKQDLMTRTKGGFLGLGRSSRDGNQ